MRNNIFKLRRAILKNNQTLWFDVLDTNRRITIPGFNILRELAIEQDCSWALNELIVHQRKYLHQLKESLDILFIKEKVNLISSVIGALVEDGQQGHINPVVYKYSIKINDSHLFKFLVSQDIAMKEHDIYGHLQWMSEIIYSQKIDILNDIIPFLKKDVLEEVLFCVLRDVEEKELMSSYQKTITKISSAGITLSKSNFLELNKEKISCFKKISLNNFNKSNAMKADVMTL